MSPYIYLLCGEVLAHQIQQIPDIQDVEIKNVKLLMAQFADDTVLFVNFDSIELNAVIDTLMYIEDQTGLKISYEKTTVYRVGSLKSTNAKLYTDKTLNWSDEDVELLGIQIPNGEVTSISYDKSIDNMEKVYQTWYLRHLTLSGKILVVNTLMSSLFVYKIMVPVADPGFSPGGAPTPKVGVPTYFFGQKLHENERIWTPRGARIPGAPLRSATGCFQI